MLLYNNKYGTFAILLLLLLNLIAKGQSGGFTLQGWKEQANHHSNMLPMYGPALTEAQSEVNKKFLDALALGKSHADIRRRSDNAMASGWNCYYRGELDTAMFRFNQAWLIDSSSIAPYIGFSTIYLTLGDSTMTGRMYACAARHDTLGKGEFQKVAGKNVNYFRKLEQQNFRITSEYTPMEYYPAGQLFIERKKAGMHYHWRWYHENGEFLRQVYGGAYKHNWKGVVTNYHDNGVIAYKGKWKHNFLKESTWTSYDRAGNVSQVEYWRKGFMSSHYRKEKTVIYSQELPWKKGTYVLIAASGWTMQEGKGAVNYPDGYIREVQNGKDPLYNYYATWKDNKPGTELIRCVPEDCTITNAEGTFEWFHGKVYKIK